MPAQTSSKALRRTALSVSTLSLLPHILCCLLPTVAALISLGTTVGLATAMAANPLYRLVDAYHPWLLGLAVLATATSGALTYLSWRIDCHDPHALHDTHGHAACHHAPCTPKKSRATHIFYVSLALLALDIAWYLTENLFLGRHLGQ